QSQSKKQTGLHSSRSGKRVSSRDARENPGKKSSGAVVPQAGVGSSCDLSSLREPDAADQVAKAPVRSNRIKHWLDFQQDDHVVVILEGFVKHRECAVLFSEQPIKLGQGAG